MTFGRFFHFLLIKKLIPIFAWFQMCHVLAALILFRMALAFKSHRIQAKCATHIALRSIHKLWCVSDLL